MAVGILPELLHQHAAPDVVGDQQHHQQQLEVHPAGGVGLGVHGDHPDAEGGGDHRAGGHDAPEQLALHDLEALIARLVTGLGVVDEQPRQVEQAREPGHHEDHVQGLGPQVGAHPSQRSRLRSTSDQSMSPSFW